MMLITLQEAEQEFIASVAYYELRESGLGERFRNEVANTAEWIIENPTVPRLRRREYRRVDLPTFPHYIAYVIRDERIWVVAIAHVHRRPEFWIDRV